MENTQQNLWEPEKWLKKSRGPVTGPQQYRMCVSQWEKGTCRLSLCRHLLR